MIAGLFQLSDAPAEWARQRALQYDRNIEGRPCRGFVVRPPTPHRVNDDGSAPVPDAQPPRFVVLTDRDERIVQVTLLDVVEQCTAASADVAEGEPIRHLRLESNTEKKPLLFIRSIRG
jgi:hypothetical protein